MNKFFSLLLCGLMAVLLSSCGGGNSQTNSRASTLVHIYIADFDFLNPVVLQESTSREICNLIFPRLLKEGFDSSLGLVTYAPLFAKSWDITDSNRTLTYHLRNDVNWTDGKPVTSKDWKFTYILYADTMVASTRQNFTDNFLKGGDGRPSVEKAVQTPDDTTLIIRFDQPMAKESMFKYTNLGFIAAHVWKDLDRKFIRKDDRNFNPAKIIGAGPYKVEKWTRNQECVLIANEQCTLPYTPKIKRFVTRFVPEYTTRLTQLKTGEADFVQQLLPNDAVVLERDNPNTEIRERGYMVYDYIAWMNIDNEHYNKTHKEKDIRPHPVFGSKKVRQALTTAINRRAIIEGFLKGFGKTGDSDIPPVAKWATNPNLNHYDYNPDKAKAMLKEEGWKIGSDGILEKSGRKFSFKLIINAGNARRNYAATIVQQNLKDIGIDCTVEPMESNVLMERNRKREVECFLFGWNITPPDVDPSETRGSDLQRTPFNLVAYQNKKADELIAEGKAKLNVLDGAEIWKEYATLINEDQPETILYWFTPLDGINKRVKNAIISPAGVFANFYDWELTDAAVGAK
ncbi:MAG: ABC transporter substrate-binding protein [Rhizobacter sp.]|nr:ABC transporter substrate-binding protein [Chlorobiales bacterium]